MQVEPDAVLAPAVTVICYTSAVQTVAPGIDVLPLRTPTLPPATHTNCYVLGGSEVWVVEPATHDDDERQRLFVALDALVASGRRITGVFLTHHHLDHIGSARAVQGRYHAPIWAHARTRQLLSGRVAVDRVIDEGDSVTLDGQSFRALHTPGHASGHLCLWEPVSGALIAGDMVAGIGTILIDPDDGDMGRYISELERLAGLAPKVLLPAHGSPIEDAVERLQHYVRHRRARESKVLEALQARGRSTPFELLPRAYDDVPESIYPIAEPSCLSHLLKLVRDGLVRNDGSHFELL